MCNPSTGETGWFLKLTAKLRNKTGERLKSHLISASGETHPLVIPKHIQTQRHHGKDTILFGMIESKFICLCCNDHFFLSKHFSFTFPHNWDYMFTYIILHKHFSPPDERLTHEVKITVCSAVPKTFTFHVKVNLLGVSRVIPLWLLSSKSREHTQWSAVLHGLLQL